MYYGQQETNTLTDAATGYTTHALYWAEQQYKNVKNITNSFYNLICKLINLP